MTSNVKYDLSLDFDNEAKTATLTVNGVASDPIDMSKVAEAAVEPFQIIAASMIEEYQSVLNRQDDAANREVAKRNAAGIDDAIALNDFFISFGESGKFGDIRKFAATLGEAAWEKFINFAEDSILATHPFAPALGIASPIRYDDVASAQDLYEEQTLTDIELENGMFWEAFDDQSITVTSPQVFEADKVMYRIDEFLIQRILELVGDN